MAIGRRNKFPGKNSTVIVSFSSVFIFTQSIVFGLPRFIVVLFISICHLQAIIELKFFDSIENIGAVERLKLLISLMKWEVKWPLVNQKSTQITKHWRQRRQMNETKHILEQHTKAHKNRFDVKCRPICQIRFQFQRRTDEKKNNAHSATQCDTKRNKFPIKLYKYPFGHWMTRYMPYYRFRTAH